MPFDSGANPNPSFNGVTISGLAGLDFENQLDNSSDQVMTSPDGVNWTLRSTPHFSAIPPWKDIEYSPDLGQYVAVSDGGAVDRVMYSADAINWTKTVFPFALGTRCVQWSPALGIWVAVGTGTTRTYWSPDGITWNLNVAANPNMNLLFNAIAWSPPLGLFAAVNQSATGNGVQTSPDGLVWTDRVTGGV
jgi:hypothetical protein